MIVIPTNTQPRILSSKKLIAFLEDQKDKWGFSKATIEFITNEVNTGNLDATSDEG